MSDYNMELDLEEGSGAWIYACTHVICWFATVPAHTPFLFFLLFVNYVGHL